VAPRIISDSRAPAPRIQVVDLPVIPRLPLAHALRLVFGCGQRRFDHHLCAAESVFLLPRSVRHMILPEELSDCGGCQMKPSVAIITTCKGRLDFLRRSLPRMVATGLPVTVVDYDCPEGTAVYVASTYPTVRVVSVPDRPVWNQPEACNAGARGIDDDFLLFLDADILLGDAFGHFLAGIVPSENEFFWGTGDPQLCGQCLIPRRRFDEIGGYDLAITGWGYHDVDLYSRLRLRGLRQIGFPAGLLAALPHSDDLRTLFNVEQNKWQNQRINSIYSQIKIDIESLNHQFMPIDQRRQLRALIATQVSYALSGQSEKAILIEIPLKSMSFSGPPEILKNAGYKSECSLKYTLTVVI
jgi:hypothetical protein